MTTVDTRVGTALLVLPAIAVLPQLLPLSMNGPASWTAAYAASMITTLVVVAVIWRWPDQGWRWAGLIGAFAALITGFTTSAVVDEAARGAVAGFGMAAIMVGVLGAAGSLAQAGSRTLAAAVAGMVVVAFQVGSMRRPIDFFGEPTDRTPLLAAAGVAYLCAAVLVGLGARRAVMDAALSGRVAGTALAAAFIPLAIALPWLMLGKPSGQAIDAFDDHFRATGIVALVATAIVLALAGRAGPRFALGVLALGALIAGTGSLGDFASRVTMVDRMEVLTETPEPGLGTTTWLLILAGVALGVLLALPGVRGYLAGAATLVAAVALYLADDTGMSSSLWTRVAVVALVAAVTAGAAAVCDGPSAVAVGVTGLMLAGALTAIEGAWSTGHSDLGFSESLAQWTPIALLGVAAVGLAVFTFQGLRANRVERARSHESTMAGPETRNDV